MLKYTLLKGITTINSRIFKNSSFKNYSKIISNYINISYNKNFYFCGKKLLSTQEENKPNLDKTNNHENSNKTDLVLKEKKKKQKTLKSKSEEGKKIEKAEAQSETAEKPTEKSQENADGEAKSETETFKSEKEKEYKITKEEQRQLKKQNFKNIIKESVNLKDMYQIKSSKMGAVNPRLFFDFTKFKYPNVSVKVFDRATFTADEKLEGKSLTPISPKLGPFIVSIRLNLKIPLINFSIFVKF